MAVKAKPSVATIKVKSPMASSEAGDAGKTGQRCEAVERFLATLEHPLKREWLQLREIILAADPSIAEGIKWNSASFRTHEYFATFNLRSRDRLQCILHFGAKVNEISKQGVVISDPENLLEWRGKDRAILSVDGFEHLTACREAVTALVREWIAHVR